MNKHTSRSRLGVLGSLAALTLSATAIAATPVIVRITQHSPNWGPTDIRGGGQFKFTKMYGAPPGLGTGSLQLTTTNSTADKVDYFTFDHLGTPLVDVHTLSYWTYQPVGQVPFANASYQLQIDADGEIDGVNFTTLVFEAYQNPLQGPIVPGDWQDWDVSSGTGNLWSSRNVTVGDCILVAGAGGPPFYTLADVQEMCPCAVVIGIGVNVGTFNPGYTVATDGVRFNDITYDFELGLRPKTENDCKKGGWQKFDDPKFKNQGQCISWVQKYGD